MVKLRQKSGNHKLIQFMNIYSLMYMKYIIIFNGGNIFVFCEAEVHAEIIQYAELAFSNSKMHYF